MSDESDLRMKNLVQGLIQKTTTSDPWGKQLEWERVGVDTYDLTLSSTTINVASQDGDGNFPYILRIMDEDGREIEAVIDTASNVTYGIGNLYKAIARTNSKLDNKLTEIMSELGITEPEKPPF